MTKQRKANAWDRLRGHDRSVSKIRRLLGSASYTEAEHLILKAQSRFPKSETISILAGRNALLTGNSEAALEALTRIQWDSVHSIQDRLELADFFRQLKEYGKAAEIFNSIRREGTIEQARSATQSLVSISFRQEDYDRGLWHAVNCVKLGGWHHQHAITKLAKHCSRTELRTAIKQLQEIEPTDPWIRNHQQKMISQFAVSLSDWKLANESITEASKSALRAHRPELQWDDSQTPLKPSVLVIGAMKAGTSALFNCLCSHPDFVPPQYKELHFFNQTLSSDSLPIEYYLNQFPRLAPAQGEFVTGEATPGYYAVNAASRVKAALPDAKIIFMRRDPTDRAISHLFHNRNTGVQEHSLRSLTMGFDPILELAGLPLDQFRNAMDDIESGRLPVNRFLLMGCYDLLLRDWKQNFGADQLLELRFEDFSNDLQPEMDRVLDFVGLSAQQINLPKELNAGRYNASSNELDAVRRELTEFYQAVEKAFSCDSANESNSASDRKSA